MGRSVRPGCVAIISWLPVVEIRVSGYGKVS